MTQPSLLTDIDQREKKSGRVVATSVSAGRAVNRDARMTWVLGVLFQFEDGIERAAVRPPRRGLRRARAGAEVCRERTDVSDVARAEPVGVFNSDQTPLDRSARRAYGFASAKSEGPRW